MQQLIFASERPVLYQYVTLSIVLLSTTRLSSSFLMRFSFFRKFISKLIIENIQNLQWLSQKMPEIPSTVFLEEPMLVLLALKWNLYEKAFSCVMVKTNSNYFVKVAEMSNHSFPTYLLTHFAQTFVLFNMFLIEHLVNRTYFVNIWKMSDIAKLLF